MNTLVFGEGEVFFSQEFLTFLKFVIVIFNVFFFLFFFKKQVMQTLEIHTMQCIVLSGIKNLNIVKRRHQIKHDKAFHFRPHTQRPGEMHHG